MAVQLSNGDVTATGRVTGAKVKVSDAADLEVGNSDTLATLLAAKASSSDITTAVSNHNSANDAHSSLFSAKQNMLTAGTGIAISNDTISTDAVRSFSAVGTQTPSVSGGVADLSTLFSGANSSLVGAIDGELKADTSSLTGAASGSVLYRIGTLESTIGTINSALDALNGEVA